jgi:hypothetical protein
MRIGLKAFFALAVMVGLLSWGGVALADEGVHYVPVAHTPTYADYLGTLTINGAPAQVGDEVGVFDPHGDCCGSYAVETAGNYGMLHVYGDDTQVAPYDGARTGDTLTFKVWHPTGLAGGTEWTGGQVTFSATPPTWADQQQNTINITATTPPPAHTLTVTGIPDEPGFGFQQQMTLHLNNYAVDSHGDDTLTWVATCPANLTGHNFTVAINQTTGVATITAPGNWVGSETWRFTATCNGTSPLTAHDDAVFTVSCTPITISHISLANHIPNGGSTPLYLDDCVTIPDSSCATLAQLTWTTSGNSNLTVTINPTTHVATIAAPNNCWAGTEGVTFHSIDSLGNHVDSNAVQITVDDIDRVPHWAGGNAPSPTVNVSHMGTATLNLASLITDLGPSGCTHDETSVVWSTPDAHNKFSIAFNTPSAGVATITALSGFSGSQNIGLMATDPQLNALTGATLTVTIANPTWTATQMVNGVSQEWQSEVTLNPLSELRINLQASTQDVTIAAVDPDSAYSPPASNVTFEQANGAGLWSFRPSFSQADHTYAVQFTGTYTSGSLTPKTVTIHVPAVLTPVTTLPAATTGAEATQVSQTVTSEENAALAGATITIPPAALQSVTINGDAQETITVQVDTLNTSALPPLPPGQFGLPVHLGPDGAQFSAPVTITIPYTGTLPDPLVVVYFDITHGVWSTSGITDVTANTANHTLTFKTTHFSVFTGAQGATTPTASTSTSSSGWCFIATAAFGSPLEAHVALLREFRDKFLLTNGLGHAFVDFYYSHSPALASFISQHPALRMMARGSLYPVAGMAYLALHGSPWQWGALLLLLGGALALGLRYVRRGEVKA